MNQWPVAACGMFKDYPGCDSDDDGTYYKQYK